MDYYLSIEGAKQGPYSIFKVGELLASGTVTTDTLAWHRGLEEWAPICEIPALEAFLERSQPSEDEDAAAAPPPPPLPRTALAAAAETATAVPVVGEAPDPSAAPVQTRPFLRFWARMFDYTAVSVLVFQLSDVAVPELVPGESISDLLARYFAEMQKPEARSFTITLFLSLVGWHFVEAMLLHVLGTTPGKALFGVRVRTHEGEMLPVGTALGRSFYVYVLGVGFYQFPFIAIAMAFSFFRLSAAGQCLWDQHLRTRIETTPLSVARIMLAIGAFFALFLFQSVKFS